MTARRWASLGVAGAAVLLAACGVAADPADPAGGTGGRGDTGSTGGTAAGGAGAEDSAASGPDADVVSALDDPDDPRLPDPLVDTGRIISGGPPPDGIPPIDDPQFVPASEVDGLADDESVVSVTVAGETRAYPVRILTFHEIVNDELAGVPVAVTYCPLCNSALAFERTVDDRVLDFGTSGRLYLSNLVMYDRQTESLWPQAEGRAVAGELTGTELARVPAALLPWGAWREANPDADVLSEDTGASRDYGTNPYLGYDDPDSSPFLFDGDADPRLPAMTRVVGFGDPAAPTAVTTEELLATGVVGVELDGRSVVVLAAPGQVSALEGSRVDGGRDVGTTGVFVAEADDGEPVTLAAGDEPGRFVDEESGSSWTVLGEAVTGPRAGVALERLPSVDTFWFTWAAFWPDTEVVEG